MDKIRFWLEKLTIMERRHNQIAKRKTKSKGMFFMTENDRSKGDEEKPEGVAISRPEDQIYQKLYLCDYLRELYEAAEEENEPPAEKKKDFRRHPPKENK